MKQHLIDLTLLGRDERIIMCDVFPVLQRLGLYGQDCPTWRQVASGFGGVYNLFEDRKKHARKARRK